MNPKSGLVVSLFSVCFLTAVQAEEPAFSVERVVAQQGFNGEDCWVHARAGVIPAGAPGNEGQQPLVIMTMQKLQLSGSDLFSGLSELRSADLGRSWTEPVALPAFARSKYDAQPGMLPRGMHVSTDLLQSGDETTVCDFTPQWHSASQRLLGIGHTVWYRNNKVLSVRPRGIAYAVFDPKQNSWSRWDTVELPDNEEFLNCGAGSGQRVDLPGGDVLIPCSFKQPGASQFSVMVCRCRFDGHTLEYVEHGQSMTVPIDRGLYEPSLVRFQGRYYLTMRNDQQGYVCVSEDGLNFAPARPWSFDDGSPLGNYNTQQHWVANDEGLYLVYTRRGADNDHVFRHRAPLFMARVDLESLRVVRRTERVLIPERGARLGNFGTVDVSPTETWVTAAEWMQPIGVEKYGSDNSVFIAKLNWEKPRHGNEPSAVELPPGDILSPYFAPPAKWEKQFGDYRSPLVFNDGSVVETSDDWVGRRAELYAEWESLLGRWPPLNEQPEMQILETEERQGITQHRITFPWTPNEETTGYLLIPPGSGPHPAVITVFYEPETAIGEGSGPYRDFAWQLANRGFVTLSLGTTRATAAKTYALYYPSIESAEVAPLSMLGYAAASGWYLLANRDDVDASRIGIVGHSFGGKWAMFAACLFEKFACAAVSDPGIVFDESRSNVNYWEPWYLGYHPQPWRKRGMITAENPARGLYPQLTAAGRDLHELHALMAPRPFLVSGGAEDPPARWEPLNHTRQINHLLGYEQRVAMTNRPDHSPNADSNAIIYAFFQHFLGESKPAR